MKRKKKKRRLGPAAHGQATTGRAPGDPPGTLVPPPDAVPPTLYVAVYGPSGHEEHTVAGIADVRKLVGKFPVVWVNVDGLADVALIEELGSIFGLHRLALEDVLNTRQRAKVEEYGDRLFVVARMWNAGPEVDTEQISMFLGPGFVVTFQERPGDCWDPVRRRIRESRKKLRESGSDYLLYALLDSLIDSYMPVAEALEHELDRLEEEVIHGPTRDTAVRIQEARGHVLDLRRTAWPLREAVVQLLRVDERFITPETRVYLRDCLDHAVLLVDHVEIQREAGSGLMDLYLSALSNKMNEVMKVLAVIGTIFMPLSFVAGVYGMNFDRSVSSWNMPELGWYYGYPFALGLMALVVAALLFFFWRRGWLR
jgi:magnesium transporter